ncbi:5-formyltetrahydrofolate cyclo-ligase [Aquirufa aurantiipilula]|uniref:5-formyltetrahydrofolate cyclo-ligase n=1 Tax=Aquirufa aurantiipilula TaxID=2696561 RepID=UPI001CAA6DC2|nr:5-formyltetrahydrofolate cyclo-ligase [Aquirufa aurantiipilula]MBZ1326286.1 5-formyltetrahydrofolate cyclo-ligase [Aquirufa aurantiipilula]
MKKLEIRNNHLALRKSLTQEEWKTRNEQLHERVLNYLSSIAKGTLVLSFQSIKGKREVDTQVIHETIIQAPYEFQLAFPRVEGDGKMSAYLVNDSTSWISSAWGIKEPDPKSAEKVKPSAIEVILVPLLGFDLQGHRVGFGKGFYDRFLAQCSPDCLKIGLSLEGPVEQIDDLHAFDIPLDVVISSDRVYTIH